MITCWQDWTSFKVTPKGIQPVAEVEMSVVHHEVIHVFPRKYDPSKYFLTFKERFNLFTVIINSIPESLGFHERKENLVPCQSS